MHTTDARLSLFTAWFKLAAVIAVIAAVIAASARPGRAQDDCLGERFDFMRWGRINQRLVPGQLEPDGYVAAGRFQRVESGGVFGGITGSEPFAIQKDHKLLSTGVWLGPGERLYPASAGDCCWLMPVEPMRLPSAGTPEHALSRVIVLEAGQRLSARINVALDPPWPGQFGIMYEGREYPVACRSRFP